jgi:ABC-2 type transport system ATP-binding protein
VLFLDEPTVGLDPRIRHELLDVIDGLRSRRELTLLLTTHYLDEAERLCDRVAIIHRGEIVALDTPVALRATLSDIVELRVEGDGARALAHLRERGVAGADAFAVGSTLTVPLDGRGAAATMAEIEVLELRLTALSTRQPTLDDVYLRLTGGRLAEAA